MKEQIGDYGLPDDMDLGEQVGVLAQFIVENFPGEPSRSEGAIETAIRLMKDLLTWKVVLEQGKEMAFEAMNRERRDASERLAEVYALRAEVERLLVVEAAHPGRNDPS